MRRLVCVTPNGLLSQELPDESTFGDAVALALAWSQVFTPEVQPVLEFEVRL